MSFTFLSSTHFTSLIPLPYIHLGNFKPVESGGEGVKWLVHSGSRWTTSLSPLRLLGLESVESPAEWGRKVWSSFPQVPSRRDGSGGFMSLHWLPVAAQDSWCRVYPCAPVTAPTCRHYCLILLSSFPIELLLYLFMYTVLPFIREFFGLKEAT